MIHITKTWLPPIEEYTKKLSEIWDSGWITSNGSAHKKLSAELSKYLDTPHLQLTSNGTLSLEIVMKSLGLEGEVITTPFSFVATTSAVKWIGLEPVFVDINPATFNIDPSKIEAAITSKTTAILCTHVFGNPCEIEALEAIANQYNLKLIFDAAPSFGVKYQDKHLVCFGDASIISCHATKIFHTAEGGIIISKEETLAKTVSQTVNFGLKGNDRGFHGLGVNGKMSELHAALGLCVLPEVDRLIERRKKVSHDYDSYFANHEKVQKQEIRLNCNYNYAYYPLIFEKEEVVLKIIADLNQNEIYPRRYFYPALTELPYLKKQEMPIAENLAKSILCLPINYDMETEQVSYIAEVILKYI